MRGRPSFRAAIRQALASRRRTVYWLGTEMEKRGTCNKRAVYGYLNGEHDIRSERLEELCEVAGVSVRCPKRKG